MESETKIHPWIERASNGDEHLAGLMTLQEELYLEGDEMGGSIRDDGSNTAAMHAVAHAIRVRQAELGIDPLAFPTPSNPLLDEQQGSQTEHK